MSDWTLHNGDCRLVLAALDAGSVDSVVTDPPYELGFMGKRWDATGIAYSVELWREVLRVLKPGGHLLAFGGTRTYHRMTCAIEDAGFEIRDCIQWIYGTGFPKSLDVSKAIDKGAGAEREVVGTERNFGASKAADGKTSFGDYAGEWNITAPATDDAKRWSGWGTALKPANEPIVMARKPLIGTVAANVLAHGTGAINVDACRIGTTKEVPVSTGSRTGMDGFGERVGRTGKTDSDGGMDPNVGRWPANVLLDEYAAAELDAQSGESTSGSRKAGVRKGMGFHGAEGDGGPAIEASSGGASRYFYVAKPSRRERDLGCEHLPPKTAGEATDREDGTDGLNSPRAGAGRTGGARNGHPTVKPVQLMRYLVRLVTPPGGTVLDPFTGSGTTGIAALQEGLRFVGIDLEPEYARIAITRIEEDSPLFNRRRST